MEYIINPSKYYALCFFFQQKEKDQTKKLHRKKQTTQDKESREENQFALSTPQMLKSGLDHY